jgi:hypothetical protein
VVHSQILSNQSPRDKSKQGFFQPTFAWAAILALVICTTLAVLAGAGKILNFAFPAASFAIGIYLYFRAPILYNGFTWWIWFLAAFIRRVVDFRTSFTEPSPLLLAPFLVTSISFITAWQYLPKAHRLGGQPFIMAMLGVIYGYFVGLINIPSAFAVTREFLDWLPPVTFGFHLLINWRNFPSYYQNTQRVFAWGTLVMGAYGVFQYLTGPGWDVDWLINSGMTSANGYPDVPVGAFGIRVFSTMQSVEPFGAFMAASLILLLNDQWFLKFPVSAVGYLAFFFSLMRSAWIGWFGGLLVLFVSLKAKYQLRLFAIILALMILIIPIVTQGSYSENIISRMQTISSADMYSGRQNNMNAIFEQNLFNVIGSGIGLGLSDNALVGMLYALGWIGMLGYAGGLIILLLKLFQNLEGVPNLFLSSSRAVVATCLIRLPANGTAITGIGGLILWVFLGLMIAAQHYYQDQLVRNLIGDKVDI